MKNTETSAECLVQMSQDAAVGPWGHVRSCPHGRHRLPGGPRGAVQLWEAHALELLVQQELPSTAQEALPTAPLPPVPVLSWLPV